MVETLTLNPLSYVSHADSVAPDQPANSTQSDLRSYTFRLSVNYRYIDLTTDSVALFSDCAYSQADLELHCPHMSHANTMSIAGNGLGSRIPYNNTIIETRRLY